MPAKMPPKRNAAPATAAPATTEAAAAPVEAVAAAPVAAAPKKAGPPKKAAPPAKVAKANKEIVKAAKPPKAAPAAVAAKAKPPTKAAPVAAPAVKKMPGKPSAKTAVENVTPKFKQIKATKHFDDGQIRAMILLKEGRELIPAFTEKKLEIRHVGIQIGAIFVAELGLPLRKCYTQPEEVSKVVKLFKTLPAELRPAKWNRTLARLAAEEVAA